jgi:hypothetical protein
MKGFFRRIIGELTTSDISVEILTDRDHQVIPCSTDLHDDSRMRRLETFALLIPTFLRDRNHYDSIRIADQRGTCGFMRHKGKEPIRKVMIQTHTT